MTSYADDLTLAVTHPAISLDVPALSARLQSAFTPVSNWSTTNRLPIAPDKSTVTLFTPWTKQYHAQPQVHLNNTQVPLNKTPKILGVTLDPLFTFAPHVASTAARASSRLQIMKAVTGSGWGQDKETLLLTYGALIKPIITYAAPIWFPRASQTSIDRLQVIQNKALRIASGSVLRADITHLHTECKTLPIKEHLSMLSKQFLASALRPIHPSHSLVTGDPGPRANSRIPLLQSAYLAELSPYLEPDNTVDPASYRSTINSIHSSTVQRYIANRPPNKVLQAQPPEISPSETHLPRAFRTTLSQLRSGQCSRLLSFRHAIGLSDTDSCPDCSSAVHTTSHLFHCASSPTTLTVEDLWVDPVGVARHLTTLSAFSDLPPLETRPPICSTARPPRQH